VPADVPPVLAGARFSVTGAALIAGAGDAA